MQKNCLKYDLSQFKKCPINAKNVKYTNYLFGFERTVRINFFHCFLFCSF